MKSSHKENQNNNNSDSIGFRGMNDNSDMNSMTKTMNTYDNLKVVIRVRPALTREMEVDLPFRSVVRIII